MRLVMKAQMGRLIFIPIPPMDEYPWQTTTAVVGIRFQSEVVGIWDHSPFLGNVS